MSKRLKATIWSNTTRASIEEFGPVYLIRVQAPHESVYRLHLSREKAIKSWADLATEFGLNL